MEMKYLPNQFINVNTIKPNLKGKFLPGKCDPKINMSISHVREAGKTLSGKGRRTSEGAAPVGRRSGGREQRSAVK